MTDIDPDEETNPMATPADTLSALRRSARIHHVDLHELEHPGGGRSIVAPAWGARILFTGSGEANCLWTSPDLGNPGLWPANYGGARTWLSPEGGPKGTYFSLDWSRWGCPAEMDRGNYTVRDDADAASIRTDNRFDLATNDGTELHLCMGRDVAVADAPPNLPEGVKALGIDFTHRLKNCGDETLTQAVDLWHLVQVIPDGVIVVPTRLAPAWRNYFQAIPNDRYEEGPAHLAVRIDGARQYKLGVPNTSATGRIGYISRRRVAADTGEALAIVKQFRVVDGAIHADRPQHDQETNGDVIQLYNHDTGGPAGFGEIECHSPAEILEPGEEQSFSIRIDVVEGPFEQVRTAASTLLECDLRNVELLG
jgi:hypothetical protein